MKETNFQIVMREEAGGGTIGMRMTMTERREETRKRTVTRGMNFATPKDILPTLRIRISKEEGIHQIITGAVIMEATLPATEEEGLSLLIVKMRSPLVLLRTQ